MDAGVIAQVFVPNLAGAEQPECGQCGSIVSSIFAGAISPVAGRTLAEKSMHPGCHDEDRPGRVDADGASRVMADIELADQDKRLKRRGTGWRYRATGKCARNIETVRSAATELTGSAKETRLCVH